MPLHLRHNFLNNCHFFGTYPFTLYVLCASASLKPGLVTVRVTSTTNVYLGETLFEYWDETRDTLRRLVRDGDMQRLFFSLWEQNIDPLPPPEPLHDVSTLGKFL